MKQDSLQQLSMAKEVFLSLIKWFVLFTLVNNLAWAVVHFYYVNKSFGDTPSTTIEATQETVEGNNSIVSGGK